MTTALATLIEQRSVAIPFSGCWIWMGALSNGYGILFYDGKPIRAHRASFIAHNPDKPIPLLVCHECDVRVCVNPAHLYSGNHTSNRVDAISRGRWTNSYGRRDHCGAGHIYKEFGFFKKADGARVCLECKNIRQRKYRALAKEMK